MSNLDPKLDAKAQAKAAKAYAKAARPWHKKKRSWFFGGILVIAGFSAVTGGGDAGTSASTAGADQSTQSEVKAKPVAVTAAQMLKDLKANALKAKTTYAGKYLKITGKVYNIDASGDYFSVDGKNDDFTLTGIMMNIGEEQRAQVANFEQDKTIVTVIGTVTDVGELLGYQVDVETIL